MTFDLAMRTAMETVSEAVIATRGSVFASFTRGVPLNLLLGPRPREAAGWVSQIARSLGSRSVQLASNKAKLMDDVTDYSVVLSFSDEDSIERAKTLPRQGSENGIKTALVKTVVNMHTDCFFPRDDSDMSQVQQMALIVAAGPGLRTALLDRFIEELRTRVFKDFDEQRLPAEDLARSLFTSRQLIWKIRPIKLVKYRE